MAFTKIAPAGLSTTGTFAVQNVNATGIITATSFSGNLTGTATTAQGLTGTPNLNVGIITATGIKAIGIYSGGTAIYSGIITALNFVGTGNTFSTNGNTVNISIAGGAGGGGSGVSSTGILTCRGFANSSVISESIIMNDFYNQGTNYGMLGPIEVSIGATITVGAGVSYAIL